MRRGVVLLALGLSVPAVLVAVLWLGQRQLVFLPDRSSPPPASDVVDGAQDVVVPTSDGLDLAAWWVPPAAGCSTTVLVAHGNGGNRADRAALADALSVRGFGVLVPDYRGYGGNPGSPSEEGLARDLAAAHRHLVTELGARPGRVVLLGESLGAAVATRLAAELPADERPAALVLRSPFTSLADAGRAAYGVPVGWVLRDRFEVTAHVGAVGVPVAVVHGDRDAVVPQAQSREVAEAARTAGLDVVEVEVAGAGHDDAALGHGPALVEAVAEVARRGGAGCG